MTDESRPNEPGEQAPRSRDVAETHPSGTIPATPPKSGETHDSDPRMSGDRVIGGRYEIRNLIGQGAMGSVYKVFDQELEELVALKTLQRRFVEDEEALENFRREVKLARRIAHENVARTYDIGVEDDVDFLTMEYIEGDRLDGYLERNAPVGNRDFFEIVEPLCRGLSAAHESGVIHRDLKPENVMLSEDGRVVITDFGLARSSAHTTLAPPDESGIVGTPAYMAPEQVREHREITERADIYAVGIMMYEMLTGRLPWEREEPVAMAVARCNNPPPRLPDDGDWPAAYRRVVHRCLQRDPEARFEDAAAIADMLESHQSADFSTYPGGFGGSTTGSWSRSSEGSGSIDPLSSDLAVGSQQNLRTVAVLPFSYAGPDDKSYLADGLTEELIDELSRSDDVAVLPMGAVQTYRSGETDPREAGEELGVQLVAEGSLRQFGETLRARVGVTSVHEGFQLWAENFSVEPVELLDVANTAAKGIQEALTERRADSAELEAPSDPVAVDLYMQARQATQKGWYTDLSGALDLYRRARERAPEDPRILSGLATTRARAAFVDNGNAEEHLEAAHETAERAVSLASDWPQPYVAKAMAHYNGVEFRPALRALAEALELAPDFAAAHDLRGRILVEIGPLDTAIEHLEQATELNPHLYAARWDLARASALRGDWARTDELMDRPVDSDTHRTMRHADRSRIDIWRDEPRWADQSPNQQLDEDSEFYVMPRVWRHVTETGRFDDAYRERMEEVVDLKDPESRYACMHFQFRTEIGARVGDDRYAMENLERSIGAGLVDINWLEHCPLLADFENHPSYEHARSKVRARVDEIFGR